MCRGRYMIHDPRYTLYDTPNWVEEGDILSTFTPLTTLVSSTYTSWVIVQTLGRPEPFTVDFEED